MQVDVTCEINSVTSEGGNTLDVTTAQREECRDDNKKANVISSTHTSDVVVIRKKDECNTDSKTDLALVRISMSSDTEKEEKEEGEKQEEGETHHVATPVPPINSVDSVIYVSSPLRYDSRSKSTVDSSDIDETWHLNHSITESDRDPVYFPTLRPNIPDSTLSTPQRNVPNRTFSDVPMSRNASDSHSSSHSDFLSHSSSASASGLFDDLRTYVHTDVLTNIHTYTNPTTNSVDVRGTMDLYPEISLIDTEFNNSDDADNLMLSAVLTNAEHTQGFMDPDLESANLFEINLLDKKDMFEIDVGSDEGDGGGNPRGGKLPNMMNGNKNIIESGTDRFDAFDCLISDHDDDTLSSGAAIEMEMMQYKDSFEREDLSEERRERSVETILQQYSAEFEVEVELNDERDSYRTNNFCFPEKFSAEHSQLEHVNAATCLSFTTFEECQPLSSSCNALLIPSPSIFCFASIPEAASFSSSSSSSSSTSSSSSSSHCSTIDFNTLAKSPSTDSYYMDEDEDDDDEREESDTHFNSTKRNASLKNKERRREEREGEVNREGAGEWLSDTSDCDSTGGDCGKLRLTPAKFNPDILLMKSLKENGCGRLNAMETHVNTANEITESFNDGNMNDSTYTNTYSTNMSQSMSMGKIGMRVSTSVEEICKEKEKLNHSNYSPHPPLKSHRLTVPLVGLLDDRTPVPGPAKLDPINSHHGIQVRERVQGPHGAAHALTAISGINYGACLFRQNYKSSVRLLSLVSCSVTPMVRTYVFCLSFCLSFFLCLPFFLSFFIYMHH